MSGESIGLGINARPRNWEPLKKDVKKIPECAKRYWTDKKKMEIADQAEFKAWQNLESLIHKNAKLRNDGLAFALHRALSEYQRTRKALRGPATDLESATGNFLMMLGVHAEKSVSGVVQNIENAPRGGAATAHYNNGQIEQAFRDYKQRNPQKSLWDAANALIRQGMPLDKWKRYTSAWSRIDRIAKNIGITRDEWFEGL